MKMDACIAVCDLKINWTIKQITIDENSIALINVTQRLMGYFWILKYSAAFSARIEKGIWKYKHKGYENYICYWTPIGELRETERKNIVRRWNDAFDGMRETREWMPLVGINLATNEI